MAGETPAPPALRSGLQHSAASYRGHLRRAGADRVVVSGELDSFMLTAAAISPGLGNVIKDALTFGHGSDVWTEPIPADFAGRTFKELAGHWLTERHWILLGLVREQRKLEVEDVLSGDRSSIDDFILRRFELAGRGISGSSHAH